MNNRHGSEPKSRRMPGRVVNQLADLQSTAARDLLFGTYALSEPDFTAVVQGFTNALSNPVLQQIARVHLLGYMRESLMTCSLVGVEALDYEIFVERFIERAASEAGEVHMLALQRALVERAAGQHLSERAELAGELGLLSSPKRPPQDRAAEVVAQTNKTLPAWVRATGTLASAAFLVFFGCSCGSDVLAQPSQTVPAAAPSKMTPALDVSRVGKGLLRTLDSLEPREKSAAFAVLGYMGRDGAAALPKLREILENRDDLNDRASAAWAIGMISDCAKEDVAALIQALKDRMPLVGQVAAVSLGSWGPAAKSSVPAMNDLLTNDDLASDLRLALQVITIQDRGARLEVQRRLASLDPLRRNSPVPRVREFSTCMCSFS